MQNDIIYILPLAEPVGHSPAEFLPMGYSYQSSEYARTTYSLTGSTPSQGVDMPSIDFRNDIIRISVLLAMTVHNTHVQSCHMLRTLLYCFSWVVKRQSHLAVYRASAVSNNQSVFCYSSTVLVSGTVTVHKVYHTDLFGYFSDSGTESPWGGRRVTIMSHLDTLSEHLS